MICRHGSLVCFLCYLNTRLLQQVQATHFRETSIRVNYTSLKASALPVRENCRLTNPHVSQGQNPINLEWRLPAESCHITPCLSFP